MAKVPRIENGRAIAGMIVAETFRRNKKITRMTSARVTIIVNWISLKAARIFLDRSLRICRVTEGGICAWKYGKSRRIASVVSMVLVPGWRMIIRLMARSVLSLVTNHD